jgi:hypothetical protein
MTIIIRSVAAVQFISFVPIFMMTYTVSVNQEAYILMILSHEQISSSCFTTIS